MAQRLSHLRLIPALLASVAVLPAYAAPHFVSIEAIPAFTDAPAQLQALLDATGHQATSKFCVVGQQDGRYVQAYVSWPAENALILWIPHLYDAQALVHSKRFWHLERDVVPGNDVHGSTYLLTRAFVDEVLAACRQHGDTFVVNRSIGAGPTHD